MAFDNLNLNLNFRNKNITWNTEKFSLLIGETKSGIGELARNIANKVADRKFEDVNSTFENVHLHHSASFIDWQNIKSSLIVIQMIESELDPNSIRKLIKFINKFVVDNDCVVIATTYSPIVLNQFYGDENLIFVLSDSKNEILPITKLLSLDYMRHFSLGDLYERNEFFDE